MERFWMWLAWRLPKRLLYWATARAGTEASARLDKTPVPDISVLDVLRALE